MVGVPNRIAPLSLLSDEPVAEPSQDGLGLENWAQVVASVALGTEGPFTVGVFGGWGVGKTSILRLAKKLIDQSSKSIKTKVTTVEFNAAQYEDEGVALIPLVASIINELDRKHKLASASKDGVRALRTALRSLLFAVSAEVKGKVPMFGDASVKIDADKAITRYENLRSEWADFQVENTASQRVISTLREISPKAQSNHRIIVFIDDLDRCFPDKAVQLLQSVRLALNHPGFVFVLAVDPTVLENYLEKRFIDEFGLKDYRRGHYYLDKLIQLPLWIPSHEKRFEYLIERLLSSSSLRKHRKDLEPLIDLLAIACEHNPRQLIRFLNNILVSREVYQRGNLQGDFPLSAFIVAHGIRQQNDLVYQKLIRDEAMCLQFSECRSPKALSEYLDERSAQTPNEHVNQVFFRSLQNRDSMVRLLTSAAGNEWLSNGNMRKVVEAFLPTGWSSARKEVDELAWIQEQVDRALLQLGSSDEGMIIASCEVLSVLGDEGCLPNVREARAQWPDKSRAGRALFATYQKLMFSRGGLQRQ